LPHSGFELQHAGSTSEEAAVEEKDEEGSRGRLVGASGIGHQEIAEQARLELRAGRCAVRWAQDRSAEVHHGFDAQTFDRLVDLLERV
jgi:hypothetical protein